MQPPKQLALLYNIMDQSIFSSDEEEQLHETRPSLGHDLDTTVNDIGRGSMFVSDTSFTRYIDGHNFFCCKV
jgi:hypothetical protein